MVIRSPLFSPILPVIALIRSGITVCAPHRRLHSCQGLARLPSQYTPKLYLDTKAARMTHVFHLPRFALRLLPAIAGALVLAGCSNSADSGPVDVSVIGETRQIREPLRHMNSPAGKVVMESTAQGLVAFDAEGGVVPALAERWIVEDEGRSYIFRLAEAQWPDGSPVRAPEVARLLENRIQANRTLDVHGDLEAVQEVLPMTGEVIEIRLATPRPNFLQLLAQPQMGLSRRDGGTGPYRKEQRRGSLLLIPAQSPMLVTTGGEAPEIPATEMRVLRAEKPSRAIARFKLQQSSLVLGGRFQDMPLLSIAELPGNAVRVDPVQGLFGLAVVGKGNFLASRDVREALSMAIVREQLPAAFSLSGWAVTASILPRQLDLSRPAAEPRWSELDIDERRAFASNVIQQWATANEAVPALRIAMPYGTGSRRLFRLLAADWGRIGVSVQMVPFNADADLRLIDEVAPYDSATWYLGRISCGNGMSCSEEALTRLLEAGLATDPATQIAKLGEAEVLALAHGGYIPLAAPVRWALVSRRLNGFRPSPRGRHPLNQLFRAPR